MSPQIAELLVDAYLADRARETAAMALVRMARRLPAAPKTPSAVRPARGLRARAPIAWFIREA